jgi:uncharacterized protein (TIRG00374 family)
VRELVDMVAESPESIVRDEKLIALLAGLNLAVIIADAGTLELCLFSLGTSAPLDASFVAFVMASIVTILGPVPMGLGSYEATSVAMLRLMGVPFEAAVSATLLYRGFSLWLPLLLGMVLARRELKKGKG